MYATTEPLILAIDLGLTSGLAVGRRLRTSDKGRWRLDLKWDGYSKMGNLYGTLEQIFNEFSIQVVVIEYPVLNITNPYYKDLKTLVEDFAKDFYVLFGSITTVEVKPNQWKTTPACRYKPGDNYERTIHQWDALRICWWFAQYEAQKYFKEAEITIDRSKFV